MLRAFMQAVAERAEREAKEVEGATFRPEVSKLARALWSGESLSSQVCVYVCARTRGWVCVWVGRCGHETGVLAALLAGRACPGVLQGLRVLRGFGCSGHTHGSGFLPFHQ